MRTVLILLALLASGCAGYRAGRGWSTVDTGAQFAFATEMGADMEQTADWIVPHGMERNPIIGRSGERVPVPVYFAATMILETAISWALPPGARRWFEGALIGFESGVVEDNWAFGRETGASARKR